MSRAVVIVSAGLVVAAAALLSLSAASVSRGSSNPSTTSATPPALPCPTSSPSSPCGREERAAKANDDYAKLLGLNQQAVAWERPGGNATGVTEQEGSLIYTISGT